MPQLLVFTINCVIRRHNELINRKVSQILSLSKKDEVVIKSPDVHQSCTTNGPFN